MLEARDDRAAARRTMSPETFARTRETDAVSPPGTAA